MNKKEIPIPMLTGQYVTLPYSHTLHTEYDKSEKEITPRSTENYSVIQAGYMPLGITDEWIGFEGPKAADIFLEHCGKPNILAYGSPGSYAYQALLSGFRVFFLNTRLPDATYPNMYLAFDVTFAKGSTDADKFKFYGWMEPGGSQYYFALDRNDLPSDAHEDDSGSNIKEFSIPKTIIQFKPYSVTGAGKGTLGGRTTKKNGFKVVEYLRSQVKDTITKSSDKKIVSTEEFHLPYIGLFYRGRGAYGNVYKCEFSLSPITMDGKYPLFDLSIVNQNTIEHKFDFSLFDYPMYQVNMGFGDRATEECKLNFTETNRPDKFRAYMLSRREALSIGPVLEKVESKIYETMVAEIQKQFVSFLPDSSTHDLKDLMAEIQEWKSVFPKPEKASPETYLSIFNPFTTHKFTTPQPVEIKETPNSIPLSGGEDGELGKILEEGEFNWESEATVSGVNNDAPFKIWEYMLNEAYSASTDKSLLDTRMVRDGIIIADSYPESVQKTIQDLVRYREDDFNYDKSRPDICAVITPDEKISDMDDVFTWLRVFGQEKNMGAIPNIGRFRFADPGTGAQVYLSGYFSYFGRNGQLYNYLKSGTTDPFASGSWSIVTKAARNSEELIPSEGSEFEQLTAFDITYYTQQSNGLFKLGLDAAFNPKKITVAKNLGYIINYNRIKNITYNILMDNRIMDPTTVNLTALEDLINAKIAPYTRIFKGRVTTKVSLSEHPQEMGKYIVLACTDIYGDHFSTTNRSQVTIRDAADLKNA